MCWISDKKEQRHLSSDKRLDILGQKCRKAKRLSGQKDRKNEIIFQELKELCKD